MNAGKTAVTFFISILVTRNLRKNRHKNKEIRGLYWHITLFFIHICRNPESCRVPVFRVLKMPDFWQR